jgi:trehalose 6-phosphate synthase
VAIRSALQESGGVWFGWSGEVVEEPTDEPGIAVDGPLTFATLDLSRRYLAGYLRVNQMFARKLAPMLWAPDLVWVHNYHLIPLGEELRKLGWTQPIGFFLHSMSRRKTSPHHRPSEHAEA